MPRAEMTSEEGPAWESTGAGKFPRGGSQGGRRHPGSSGFAGVQPVHPQGAPTCLNALLSPS